MPYDFRPVVEQMRGRIEQLAATAGDRWSAAPILGALDSFGEALVELRFKSGSGETTAIEDLVAAEPESDEAGFIRAELQRETNRIVRALRRATCIAARAGSCP